MLAQRVWTALIGGAVFMAAVWLGGWYYKAFILAICTVSFWELLTMRRTSPVQLPSLLGWLVLFITFFGGTATILKPVWFMALLLLFLVIPVATKNKTTFTDSAFIWFGALWLGLSLHELVQIRLAGSDGLKLFLLVVLSIWATDIGAYFVGRALKGPKIWPEISPNKTVSGTIGGLFAAAIVGITFTYWGAVHFDRVVPVSGFIFWAAFSVLLSIAGQLGDFAESALKRSFDVKDSGTILPGHGGLLDRFDSLLLAAPVASYVLSFFS